MTVGLPSCASLCSLARSASTPSTSVPGCSDLQAHRKRSRTSSRKPHGPSRSLSLLSKLPRDLSSLIYSHNGSQQRSPALLAKDSQSLSAQPLSEGYANSQHNEARLPLANKTTMFAPQQNIQSVRKTENRIYSFFRSRSRSRSNGERFVSTPVGPVPQVPSPLIGHGRHSSLDPDVHETYSQIKTSPKPSTRSQSRPISSTTTATHSTITPLPSDSRIHRRYRPDPLYVTSPSSVCVSESSHDPHDVVITRERSDIPSSRPSSARRKLHTFFGISLTTPRKLSFNSRPTSPKLPDYPPQPPPHLYFTSPPNNVTTDLNTPPYPSLHQDDPPAPSRPTSPSLSFRDKGKRAWLPPKFRSASDPSSKSTDSHFASRPKSDFISSSAPSPSSPISPSSSAYMALLSGDHVALIPDSLPDILEGSTMGPTLVAPKPLRAANVPQIIHTPPTPQRAATSPPRLIDRKEMDEAYRLLAVAKHQQSTGHRQGAQDQNVEQTRVERDGRWSPLGFASPRLFGGKDLDKEKGKDKTKSRTKGGFGLDRVSSPVDGRSNREGSVVVGPPKNMSRRIKHGSFDFERPISGGSGLSRNGSILQLGLYPNRNGSRGTVLERTTSSNSRKSRKNGDGRQTTPPSTSPRSYQSTLPDAPMPPPLTPNHTGASVASSHAQSFSTTQSKSNVSSASKPSGSGLTSSLGRTAGKRAQRISVGLTHGSFAFEPAAPSPTLNEFGRQENSSGDSSNSRHRRGKGRSLDLGLGLAWAPTKMREDAIMPSFVNTRGRARASRRQGQGRPKAGSDVSEIFRNVLSETAYASFKKYVHHFDAHAIPFEGPTGLLARVEKLLNAAPGLKEQEKRELLSSFTRFVQQNS